MRGRRGYIGGKRWVGMGWGSGVRGYMMGRQMQGRDFQSDDDDDAKPEDKDCPSWCYDREVKHIWETSCTAAIPLPPWPVLCISYRTCYWNCSNWP